MDEHSKVKARYTKKIKIDVVNAIINGELWIEEAMSKYNIQDRRVVIAWLRKHLREIK
ncbi:hypothetical protein [Sphingobacterium detergens]|uniref:Transposase n=1 Tax=Sphingobacterium detergens TaxID=1145106 RepID=A0A420BK07_SPHD1|nr:hypothetical protein [Sphingobacterium detergens]RKE57058.1 hypothetical protein DFQ12_1934 [Sphingobacterium detergens]